MRLTSEEAAARLGKSAPQIRYLIQTGRTPANKRTLKIPDYLRYMDDFVLFHEDRGTLEAARDEIAAWLRRERSLALKREQAPVVPNCEATRFLGYRTSRAGITPSRKLRRRFEGRVRQAAERGPDALERTLRSYRGLLLF